MSGGAEGEGFEPPETCASAVFKQGAHKPLTCSDAPEQAAAPRVPRGRWPLVIDLRRRLDASVNQYTARPHTSGSPELAAVLLLRRSERAALDRLRHARPATEGLPKLRQEPVC
jgi:hypothetical protein